MAENVLRIEAKRYREDSVVMSARIPKDMLQDIDFVAKESGRTRNEIVTMFLDFALKNTEIIDKQ
ncbi:CopG family transcriptional regulator [Eubacterium sp. MSJ-21]|nr:CopG family transcriptional regulator [Eubacterium sp. MSJ-21]